MAKGQESGIKFEVDRAHLYRDESFTDLKSATIRRLTPVNMDGTVDESRKILYFGHAELISPQGPIPVQAPLDADSLEKAIDALPAAMEKAAVEVRNEYNKMLEQQRVQQENQSKIISSND